jgi:hypothetical protein
VDGDTETCVVYTLSVKDADAVFGVGLLSVTVTAKGNAPGVVGAPDSTPEADKLTPLGNEPLVTEKLYGVVPPLATRVT